VRRSLIRQKPSDVRPGDPKCPTCEGDGFVQEPEDPPHPPSFEICSCVLFKEVATNVERGMPGLIGASVIDVSPLLGKEEENLLLTFHEEDFRSNMRHVAVRNPPTWNFKVCSDAELVTAWLATAALNGNQILDPDAISVSMSHATIADLVVPPDLLVIRMGIKAARNAACGEVLIEALQLRTHAFKPTWIWDQPSQLMVPGHLFYSDMYEGLTRGWERVSASTQKKSKRTATPSTLPEGAVEGGRFVLSGATSSGTRRSLRKDSQ
jgi:hypothetical protein